MAKLLTIVMPTFNRNRQAVENVRRLLPQLRNDDVELVVLDNHSTIPITETLRRELSQTDAARVTVVRNRTNLGMTGNSLRTFEVGDGEFIWTLCDDDQVRSDAVEAVLAGIRKNRDCVYLWFPVEGGPPHLQPGRYRGIAAAIKAEPNLFFVALSCCIFRRNFFSERLRIGYLYSYSWASFMCPLLAEMDNADNTVYISHAIVAAAGPVDAKNKWSKLDACLGMRTLLELPMSVESRKYLKQSIDSFSFSTARLFIDSTAINNAERWGLFRIYLTRRYAPLTAPLVFWITASSIAQWAPRLTSVALKTLEKLAGRRLLMEVEDRFERS